MEIEQLWDTLDEMGPNWERYKRDTEEFNRIGHPGPWTDEYNKRLLSAYTLYGNLSALVEAIIEDIKRRAQS